MIHAEIPPEDSVLAVPPAELIERVAGDSNPDWFLSSGRTSVQELSRTLGIAGRTLDSFESLLDFGCGCGRMLRWMEPLTGRGTVHGTDIDAEGIEWCQTHLPFARCTVNDADPPLPFGDASFDLVFNHSVFTHIDERRQDRWLTELRRVTRPGGLLVLSTHGLAVLPDDRPDFRAALEQDGIVFLDGTASPTLGLPDWYQTTLHAPWYIYEHWGRWFEIRAHVPGGSLSVQDHVLLERRPDDSPPRRPIAARPRESTEDAAPDAPKPLRAAERDRASALAAPSRHGTLGTLARRTMLRLLRPYTAHEDRFDAAVSDAVRVLETARRDHERRLGRLERRNRDSL